MRIQWWTMKSIAGVPHQAAHGGEGRIEHSPKHLPKTRLASFSPDFKEVQVTGRMELTDLVTSGLTRQGFYASKRLLDVLIQHRLQPHQVYDANLFFNGEPVSGYSFIHLPGELFEFPDGPIPEVENWVASHPVVCDLDLVRNNRPARYAYCFVSKQLRRFIEHHKLTGIRFGTSKLFRTKREHE